MSQLKLSQDLLQNSLWGPGQEETPCPLAQLEWGRCFGVRMREF